MIKFFSLIPSATRDFPITQSNNVKFDWAENAKIFYKNDKESVKITKCPGIFSVLSKGWIQRTYQDITIETFGDKKSFTWSTPIDQLNTEFGRYLGNYVDYHNEEQFANFNNNFSENNLRTIIKIQSPWFIEIPKDYSLLVIPIPYSDNPNFTAAIGLLKGNQFLNVQIFWHVLNGKVTIKKGTPLNQMILIKDEVAKEAVYEIDDMSKFEKEYLIEFFEQSNKRYKDKN